MRIGIITPILHLHGILELLQTKGEIFLKETGTKNEIRSFIQLNDIDTIICNPNQQMFKIDSELLDNTRVKLINTCSTGLNHIDIDYCNENNITVLSLTNDYELLNELPSTAELAFTLMCSLLRNVHFSINDVSQFNWDYTKFVGRQIKDLTIGIIGYGRLGSMMASYCNAFGSNVIVYDPYKTNLDTKFVSLHTIAEESDVISLHVHVTRETKYMIDKNFIGKCRKKPYIINTSRGEIVNECDIINGLDLNLISGYGTDVIEHEFDDIKKSPIISAMNRGSNIIVTPHIGGMTYEGQLKAYKWAINKL